MSAMKILVEGELVNAPAEFVAQRAIDVQAPQAAVEARAVPSSVSRAQAKIALHRAGLLDMVKTAVAADPEVQIWFDDALVWERQNPHVIALGEQLFDGETVDGLFIAAAQIET